MLHLGDNHRSTRAILELVNAVSEVALPAAGRRGAAAGRAAPSSRPTGWWPGAPAARRAAAELLVDGEGGDAAARREREAAGARRADRGAGGRARRRRWWRRRVEGGGERLRRPRFGDVAILFRRLTALGPYERALRAAGIPFQVARGGGFYRAPEVRDLGELLASLADPATRWPGRRCSARRSAP